MTNTFGKVKALCAMLVTGLGLTAFSATPSVTSVTAQQRYPWNGLVDIVVTFNGAQSDVAKAKCTFAATDSATKNALTIAHVTQQRNDTGSGTTWTRCFIWDTNADVGEVKIDDFELDVGVEGYSGSGGVQLWKNGPYWSTCNVGASTPQECGLYFWWGGTMGYEPSGGAWSQLRNGYTNVTWVSNSGICCSTSPFTSETCMTYEKDVSALRAAGFIDSSGNLAPEFDAATVYLGSPWRMPTEEEVNALVDNCDTEWTTRNGVNGRLIKGKGSYSSKSIFLPAAGYGAGSILYYIGRSGYFLSSTPHVSSYNSSYRAWDLYFSSSDFKRDYWMRNNGYPIRPVRGLGIVSTHLSLDNRVGVRIADTTERIRFSPVWESESEWAEATVKINGEVVKKAVEEGVYEWTPKRNGTYVFTHSVSAFDVPQGETLTATFEVTGKVDCVVHFNANGGVFRGKDGREVKEFDQYFVYGEPQKLFTDDLVPMRMDENGNQFLGWVRGTPEITSSDDLIDDGKVWTWNDDVTEETFYAVWTTTLKVMFYNTISPSSLDDHLKWQVIGKESSDILKSGESIEVGPGERKIWLWVDAAYDWLVEGFDLGSQDNQNFNAYQGVLTLNFSNDYTDPLLWREPRKSTRDVVAGVKYRSMGSRICFSCKHEIRESLRNQIKTSDVPFRASKVSITIEGTRFNESGILEPAPAHTLTGLTPGEEYFLPKGIYRIKSVTYDADHESGDPYWGAVLDVNQTFEVGADEPIDYIDIDFDLFGGEDVVMVKFDPQGGTCENTSMWYTPAYHDIDGTPHYRIYRMPPDPKKAGFEFENWFTAPIGGREVKLLDAITDCTLYAHWKTKVTEDWLLLFPELAARAKGDVETAASLTAANGCRTVGECYELGINPEDPNDDFKITGFEVKDGKPVISLNHTKDGSGNSFVQHVKTLGKENLSDGEWREVPEDGDSTLRFFKVTVESP